MHYYQFNIGDYASHTAHLDPIEDIAFRRMMDFYYLHEKPLPDDVDDIARLIRMRSHCEVIANVLREFFAKKNDEWFLPRADKEIAAYKSKSAKAKKSAEVRWRGKTSKGDANAMQSESEGNAKHKPLNTNHKTIKYSEDDFRVARFIFDKILEINAEHKKPNFDKWADDVRLMRERDKRSHSDMRDVFMWANQDSFWSRNILSPDKLRKKWDQLVINMKAPQQSDGKFNLTEALKNDMQRITEREMGGGPVCEVTGYLHGQVG